jgi:hypothetical protein
MEVRGLTNPFNYEGRIAKKVSSNNMNTGGTVGGGLQRSDTPIFFTKAVGMNTMMKLTLNGGCNINGGNAGEDNS